jgi:hypothetical protein
LNATDALKANIGISAIDEYVTMYVNNVPQGEKGIFALQQFGQAMRLLAVWIDDPDNDLIDLSLVKNATKTIPAYTFYKDRVNKSQTPLPISDIPLAPDTTIEVKAASAVSQIILVLKPVVILANVQGQVTPLTTTN